MPAVTEFDSDHLDALLGGYYSKLFPTNLMYRWLSYGNPDFFSHREFSFALRGDIYIRYQSFASDVEMQAELKRRKPEKIDIGAVYNQKPRTRDTLRDFIPQQKEFVLDIDLTDYDDVRKCCQGAKVCEKCWKFIAVAVQLMDTTLDKDFGFKHRLWVFSGRRGVHCWICDDLALNMDSHARGAILEYLTVIRGGENQLKKVKIPNIDRMHPFLKRSIEMIDDVFESICHEDQGMLGKGDKNFDMLPPEVKDATANADDRFAAVMAYLETYKEKKTLRTLISELKLQLCFPRLDVNVSKDLNHLLKSPFCIHPKTGQACVPFDAAKAFEFKPSEVPNIVNLIGELANIPSSGEEATKIIEKASSLGPYLKFFREFVERLEKQQKRKVVGKMSNKTNSLDF